LPGSEPSDYPAVVVTGHPNWRRRTGAPHPCDQTDIDAELIAQGINGVFTVEPVPEA
jgi:hypothetical protein